MIRVDDPEGQPIATLFSYGCHPVVMGPRAHVTSADFPGAARDVVEGVLGGLSLFVQACGGNINPLGGIGYEIDGSDSRRRVGTMLSGEVLKVATGIRTHVRRGDPTAIGPLQNIMLRPWHPVSSEACTYLGATGTIETLDFSDLPSADDALAIHDKWQQQLTELQARGSHPWDINFAARFVDWSGKLVTAVENGHPRLDVVVQGLRVNDIALAGISAESFFETGLVLRAQSPFAHTEVLGYTNGCVGYLPRAEDYPPGSWNVHELYSLPDMFFQSYSLPVALREDSEQRVVRRVLSVFEKLRS